MEFSSLDFDKLTDGGPVEKSDKAQDRNANRNTLQLAYNPNIPTPNK